MPADAALGLAPFVEAVSAQQTAAEMPDGQLRDVFLEDRLELGEDHVGQHAAARLDPARDGEGVPERLPEAFADQELLLGLARVADARQQR